MKTLIGRPEVMSARFHYGPAFMSQHSSGRAVYRLNQIRLSFLVDILMSYWLTSLRRLIYFASVRFISLLTLRWLFSPFYYGRPLE